MFSTTLSSLCCSLCIMLLFNYISLMQSKMISKVKPILEESMKSLYCNSVPSCFKVADLGCSSGPNALQVAYDIIDVVHNITPSYNRVPPIEFQIYLNDQFQNDFNNIFESLPSFYERLREEKGERLGSCFVNATPGSFYGRLFPTNSMHFFHSSTSLHWLSQVIFNYQYEAITHIRGILIFVFQFGNRLQRGWLRVQD